MFETCCKRDLRRLDMQPNLLLFATFLEESRAERHRIFNRLHASPRIVFYSCQIRIFNLLKSTNVCFYSSIRCIFVSCLNLFPRVYIYFSTECILLFTWFSQGILLCIFTLNGFLWNMSIFLTEHEDKYDIIKTQIKVLLRII